MQALLDADRHRARRRRDLGGSRAGASGSCRKRFGRPPPTDLWRQKSTDPGFRSARRRRRSKSHRDRSRQCRGGSARHRGRAARSGAGRARPPRWSRPTARWRAACSPRCALEYRGGRFRRRCARRHAGRRVRPARRRAALGGRQPVTLLALLKHPLLAARPERQARRRDARARHPARPAAARRQRRTCACARHLSLAARQISRKETVDLHPSDPRIELTDSELATRGRTGCAARRGAGAAGKRLAGQSHPLSELAKRHRDVVAALSRQDGDGNRALPAPTAPSSPRLRRTRDKPGRRRPAVDTSRLCRTVPRRHRRPRGAPAAAARDYACASSGRSKRA